MLKTSRSCPATASRKRPKERSKRWLGRGGKAPKQDLWQRCFFSQKTDGSFVFFKEKTFLNTVQSWTGFILMEFYWGGILGCPTFFEGVLGKPSQIRVDYWENQSSGWDDVGNMMIECPSWLGWQKRTLKVKCKKWRCGRKIMILYFSSPFSVTYRGSTRQEETPFVNNCHFPLNRMGGGGVWLICNKSKLVHLVVNLFI